MYIDILTNCFYSILSGLIIYFILIGIKQNWVNTIYYLITFMLLPPVAFVITNVISNNLALSLGMIGALSIVRFRNPVKNPLELVIYFSLITLGIAFGVNPMWGFLLITLISAILIFSRIFQLFAMKKNFLNLFKYSFSTNDGVLKNLIEVEASSKIDFLENHENLLYYSTNNKDKFLYKISVDKKLQIENLKEKISSLDNVINVEARYGD